MNSHRQVEQGPEDSRIWNFERSSPRCSLRLFVRTQAAGQYSERRGNVGAGGFFCEGDERWTPGTRLDIAFVLPSLGIRVAAEGEVLDVSDNQDHRGVRGRFVQMDGEDQRLLRLWLEEKAALGRQSFAA